MLMRVGVGFKAFGVLIEFSLSSTMHCSYFSIN